MRQQKNSGQALVPVLFVVLILTAVAVAVSTSAKREIRASTNQMAELQQYQIARGAMNYVAAQLQQATAGGVTVPQLTQPPDTDANGWTQLGDGWYKVDIIDTGSRININTADAATLNKLPAFINDPNLAPAIIDWRDADDNPTVIAASGTTAGGTGAESDYYQGLNPPYYAKNAPFDTLDELLLVRGITPAILYGVNGQIQTTTSGSGMASPQYNDATRAAGATRQASGGTTTGGTTQIDLSGSTTPLSELLTTYSRELNYAADGTKRINIKTATAAQLTTMFTNAGVATNTARNIVNQFTRPAQGQTQTQQQQLTQLSDVLGKNVNGQPVISQWTREALQVVADHITDNAGTYLNGRININTASTEALASIPGMDQALMTLIQNQQRAGGFASLNDLFTGTTFSRAQLIVLFGHVCTKSSVYLVRVRVRMTGSTRIYAAQALVELSEPQQTTTTGTGATGTGATGTGTTDDTTTSDATTQIPQILQWREVPKTPGWSSWSTPPSYLSGANQPAGSGGTVGNP